VAERARTGRLPALAEVNHEPGERALHRTVAVLNAIMVPFTGRDWRDQHKIPQQGGVIFAVNHISNADPLAVGQFLAYSGRWPRFLAKVSLFGLPIIGRVLRACGQIPVQRASKAAGDALQAAVQAVRDGKAVVIYPEGTITHDPELWPMAGKTGAARISFQTGCPVIPVGQWGAQEIMYGRQVRFPKLLPRTTLRLRVGDPVELDDLRDRPLDATVLKEATDRIMDAITALVADVRDSEPPAERFDPRGAADPRADIPRDPRGEAPPKAEGQL
jgi:1-acyl-sn-glycerol-3-phosphate acyltransferase